MTLSAAQMPVKYQRHKMTIWEVPGSGLYRVLETNKGEFRIETLTQVGWTDLLSLSHHEVTTPEQALQVWLDIQTPVSSVEPGDENEQAVGEGQAHH